MKIEKQMTAEVIQAELGRRLARQRLNVGLTQQAVAEEAGIGKRTLERIEAGGDTQLSTLLRLLRVLELTDGLNRLVPEAGSSPMDMLKLKNRGRERQRASSRSSRPRANEWTWGDEK